jgi:hypothetical protein
VQQLEGHAPVRIDAAPGAQDEPRHRSVRGELRPVAARGELGVDLHLEPRPRDAGARVPLPVARVPSQRRLDAVVARVESVPRRRLAADGVELRIGDAREMRGAGDVSHDFPRLAEGPHRERERPFLDEPLAQGNRHQVACLCAIQLDRRRIAQLRHPAAGQPEGSAQAPEHGRLVEVLFLEATEAHALLLLAQARDAAQLRGEVAAPRGGFGHGAERGHDRGAREVAHRPALRGIARHGLGELDHRLGGGRQARRHPGKCPGACAKAHRRIRLRHIKAGTCTSKRERRRLAA